MQWYQTGMTILSRIDQLLFVVGLAWFASRLFKPRFRFAALAVLVIGTVCTTGMRRLLSMVQATALVRVCALGALAFALIFAFFKGQIAAQVYVGLTFEALREIAFLQAYLIISIWQPYLYTLGDRLIASGATVSSADHAVFAASLLLEGCMTASDAIILFVLLYLVCRFLPQERPMLFNGSELRLILLPSVCALFLTALFRTIGSVTSGDPPMTFLDTYPNLLGILAAILTILCVLIAGSVRTLTRLRRLNAERERRLAMETQLNALHEQVEITEQQQNTVRRLRHDLQNTIMVVETLAETDPASLRSYLQDLDADVRSAVPEYRTGSLVADALLSSKAQTLRSKVPGVALDADRLSFSEAGAVSAYDIGIILSNALDNAIEALCELQAKEPDAPAFLRVSSFTDGTHLVMHFANSCLRKRRVRGSIPTTTKKAPGHGLGLQNIRTIAGKYDGIVDCKAADGIFELAVMLVLSSCNTQNSQLAE